MRFRILSVLRHTCRAKTESTMTKFNATVRKKKIALYYSNLENIKYYISFTYLFKEHFNENV